VSNTASLPEERLIDVFCTVIAVEQVVNATFEIEYVIHVPERRSAQYVEFVSARFRYSISTE
jgi:hypothetical protein